MRRIPTTIGAALFQASLNNPNNWMSKQVQERATHTMQGTKAERSITVHVSAKTRAKIATEQGIIV